ncbi:hypothetical protein Patl1_19922 [Pistacia atlantica]|uniref:Uncharacterized protein n=1 Tax=Pistacia atlantica TaxID=434234 RepID=A0ACC1BNG6_9ROSI|nr:hypothetical protein Patl1_19922 [Pistacia atlantica]
MFKSILLPWPCLHIHFVTLFYYNMMLPARLQQSKLNSSTIKTNPRELANAALSVSLKEVQSTSALVQKLSKGRDFRPREAGAIRDCVETIKDSVDDLQQSLAAIKDLKGPEFEWKMSDIITWVSAALTNEDTCMEN